MKAQTSHRKNRLYGLFYSLVHLGFMPLPGYQMEDFTYLSTEHNLKQWRIEARQGTYLPEQQQFEAQGVQTFLYQPETQIPIRVKSQKARYHLSSKKLEFFDATEVRFPDGFLLKSNALTYHLGPRLIEVSRSEPVEGEGPLEDQRKFSFTAKGLHYPLAEQRLNLLSHVIFYFKQAGSSQNFQVTTVQAQQGHLDFKTQWAFFKADLINPRPAHKAAFIQIQQADLTIQSRQGRLHYGSPHPSFRFLIAEEEVRIQEKPDSDGPLSTPIYLATAGRAEFDLPQNRLILTQFPQITEGSSTLTGEVIILSRSTHLIEIQRSNALNSLTKKASPNALSPRP